MGVTNSQRGRQVFQGGAQVQALKTYVADGAISAHRDEIAYLTKGSAGAYTLAAPTRDGIRLTIVGRTAFAHVVTATGLFDDGVVGGSKNAATYAAFAGASSEYISHGGKWNTLSLKAVTVA